MVGDVTPTDKFAQQLNTLWNEINELLRSPSANLQDTLVLISALFEDTQVALEELRVAGEELREQNEQLQDSRAVLEAERQHYADLFYNAQIGFIVTNPEGVIQEANRAAAQLLNITSKYLTGKPLTVFFTDIQLQLLQRKLAEFKSGNETSTWESRIQPRSIAKTHDVVLTVVRVPDLRDHENVTGTLRWLIYDITERKRIEAAEHEQRALAEALRETALILTSSLNLSEVLDRIHNCIGRIVPHEAASILLINEVNPTSPTWQGYDTQVPSQLAEALQNLHVPATTEKIFEYIASTKKSLLISDWVDHGPWESVAEISAIRSFLCAPIVVRDEVIGYIELHSSTPDFFTQAQSEHLQTFAAQAAVAIQNAKAYEQAQTLAVLEERSRLARDLHDAVTQSLFSATIVAESLLRLGKKQPDKIWPSLEKLHALTKGSLAEMRNLLLELRPEYWSKIRLPEQLRQLADVVKSRKHIDTRVKIVDGPPIQQDVQIALYRIAQEALNNVVKHSRATIVEIVLDNQPDKVALYIRDNGRGFDTSAVISGLGMDTMRERAEVIHASFQISTERGKGTEIAVLWSRS